MRRRTGERSLATASNDARSRSWRGHPVRHGDRRRGWPTAERRDVPMALTVVLPEVLLRPVAQASASVLRLGPAPTPSPQPQLEDFEVSPGLLGFIPPFLIALACVGLFMSLTRQLRRVTIRQAAIDAAEAASADDSAGAVAQQPEHSRTNQTDRTPNSAARQASGSAGSEQGPAHDAGSGGSDLERPV